MNKKGARSTLRHGGNHQAEEKEGISQRRSGPVNRNGVLNASPIGSFPVALHTDKRLKAVVQRLSLHNGE